MKKHLTEFGKMKYEIEKLISLLDLESLKYNYNINLKNIAERLSYLGISEEQIEDTIFPYGIRLMMFIDEDKISNMNYLKKTYGNITDIQEMFENENIPSCGMIIFYYLSNMWKRDECFRYIVDKKIELDNNQYNKLKISKGIRIDNEIEDNIFGELNEKLKKIRKIDGNNIEKKIIEKYCSKISSYNVTIDKRILIFLDEKIKEFYSELQIQNKININLMEENQKMAKQNKKILEEKEKVLSDFNTIKNNNKSLTSLIKKLNIEDFYLQLEDNASLNKKTYKNIQNIKLIKCSNKFEELFFKEINLMLKKEIQNDDEENIRNLEKKYNGKRIANYIAIDYRILDFLNSKIERIFSLEEKFSKNEEEIEKIKKEKEELRIERNGLIIDNKELNKKNMKLIEGNNSLIDRNKQLDSLIKACDLQTMRSINKKNNQLLEERNVLKTRIKEFEDELLEIEEIKDNFSNTFEEKNKIPELYAGERIVILGGKWNDVNKKEILEYYDADFIVAEDIKRNRDKIKNYDYVLFDASRNSHGNLYLIQKIKPSYRIIDSSNLISVQKWLK